VFSSVHLDVLKKFHWIFLQITVSETGLCQAYVGHKAAVKFHNFESGTHVG